MLTSFFVYMFAIYIHFFTLICIWGKNIIILVSAPLNLSILVCTLYVVIVSRLLNLTCDRVASTPELRTLWFQ